MTISELRPQAPTKTHVTISKALYAHERPWTGECATAAAAAIYDALADQALLTRADRDAVIVLIAHRLEDIQHQNDTGFCGPDNVQRLETTLRAANVLK